MSTQYLNAAFSAEVKPSATKFVLVALADYANELGESYPSVETMEHKTCQDRKTIMLSISRLINAGLLSDTGERKGKTKQIPVYKIHMDELKRLAFNDYNRSKNGTVRQYQNRHSSNDETEPKTELLYSTKNGTVPKTEQSRFSVETVPFFPENEGKESQKRYTEPSVYNHQLEPSVSGIDDSTMSEKNPNHGEPVQQHEAPAKQSPKKVKSSSDGTRLTQEWIDQNTSEMKTAYFAEMRGAELRATESRWNLILGDFVEHWINSATNAAKFKKISWIATWENHVSNRVNFNKNRWKAEDAPRANGSSSRLGSLENDYLKGADWERIRRGEG